MFYEMKDQQQVVVKYMPYVVENHNSCTIQAMLEQ